VKLDKQKNEHVGTEEAVISADDSKVSVAVVPTNEELLIAIDTYDIVSQSPDSRS
jgi:acetate kinase